MNFNLREQSPRVKMKTKRIPFEHKHGQVPAHNSAPAHDQAPAHGQETLFSWETPEHFYQEKGVIWHILVGCAIAGLVAYSIYDHAWTFLIAIAISVATYYYFIYREEPKIIAIKITESEIKIGRHAYVYEDIRYFWIIENQWMRILTIRLKKHFLPDIEILINGHSTEILQGFLETKIKKVEKKDSMINMLVRLFKI